MVQQIARMEPRMDEEAEPFICDEERRFPNGIDGQRPVLTIFARFFGYLVRSV